MALIELTIQEPALIKNPAFKRIESGSKSGGDDVDEDGDPEAEDEITDLTLEEEVDDEGGLPTKLLAIAVVCLAVVGVLTLKKLRGTPENE